MNTAINVIYDNYLVLLTLLVISLVWYFRPKSESMATQDTTLAPPIAEQGISETYELIDIINAAQS